MQGSAPSSHEGRRPGLASKRGRHHLLAWGLAGLLCCKTNQPPAPTPYTQSFHYLPTLRWVCSLEGLSWRFWLEVCPVVAVSWWLARKEQGLEEARTGWASPSPVWPPVSLRGLVWASSWHGGFKFKFSASNLEAASPFLSWPHISCSVPFAMFYG